MADSLPLDTAAVAQLLGVTVPLIRSEIAALPAAVVTWHPAPGEWCVNEIVGHLIEAERRGFAGRIRVMLASPHPDLQGWDQVAVARERHDCARSAGALVDELAALRADAIAMVAGLTADDVRRRGLHPKVGELSVADLLHEWVHHDRNHLRQLLANVQAFVWPGMGNAQQFSAD